MGRKPSRVRVCRLCRSWPTAEEGRSRQHRAEEREEQRDGGEAKECEAGRERTGNQALATPEEEPGEECRAQQSEDEDAVSERGPSEEEPGDAPSSDDTA